MSGRGTIDTWVCARQVGRIGGEEGRWMVVGLESLKNEVIYTLFFTSNGFFSAQAQMLLSKIQNS